VRRSFPVLAAVLGAVLLLSACGSDTGAAAAKVNTTRILRSDLNDQLEALSNNTKWIKQAADQFGEKTLVQPNGGVSSRLAAAWLTALMNQAIVDQAFDARHLKVTDANRKAAKQSAEGLFNTDDGQTFGSMPKWFQDDFLASQSRYEAVSATAPANPKPAEKDLEPLVEGAYAQYCNSGNAVSHILVNTRAEADQIEAELAAGADFQTLADTKSLDTGSKDLGGFLSCDGSANYPQLPEDFRQAAATVPLGTISAPIQTAAGFHVIKVSAFDLANVRKFLEALYTSSLEPPMTQFINNQLLKAKLWVDPRYGTLGKGPVRVNAPEAPKVRNRPPATSSTTAPAGS
jgi:outer membrane murein-binding lipoprotein Lpp